MKKFLAFLIATLMVVSLFAGCAGGTTAKNTEFVIGMSGPLTGGAAVYGVAVQNSAQIAVDEINAAGGLNGYKFKLIATDDQHDPTKVATNYATLLEKGVHVSLGTVTTKPGIEFKNLSKQDNLFFLTPSASGDDVPEFANGYQMCFADGDQGKVAAEYVNTLGLEKIGVFFKSDDPYSDGIYKNFTANLNDNITVIETQFTDANATDFSAQITQLKDCSFIFMPIYYQPAAIFMKQAKDTMAANAIYYGCDGFDGLTGEMDLTTITQEVSMLSHFDANSTEGKAAEFIKKYTEKYDTDTLNQFGASAYDSVYAIYGAMKELIEEGKKVTPDTTASELCEMLKAKFNGGYSFAEGATGSNITWYETGKVNKVATKYTLKEAN